MHAFSSARADLGCSLVHRATEMETAVPHGPIQLRIGSSGPTLISTTFCRARNACPRGVAYVGRDYRPTMQVFEPTTENHAFRTNSTHLPATCDVFSEWL